MGNGYGNLLWILLLMDNGQSKQVGAETINDWIKNSEH